MENLNSANEVNRRQALGVIGASAVAMQTNRVGIGTGEAFAQEGRGNDPSDLEVLPPRNRIPLSFIIDDSTCLVNMGHFCMPQFAAAWPEREVYRQPWKDWPREIPDRFVREFGEWCAEYSVKGKYSIVPYPACVGWVDRFIPGWSKRELDDSLALVRDLMVPNWDIHPEMISHTRVVDLKTGRPMDEATSATMENSFPQTDISTDYLAEYLAYALRVLKNCDLPCEGITTPGGFGNRVKDKLPIAVHQAVRDVYGTELPHYFKYVRGEQESTVPTLEYIDDSNTVDRLTINVPAGTGDWFGGWEGTQQSDPDRYCDEDATGGRMVEMIKRGEPAVMLCHWPGMYCNGSKTGFKAFQRVVRSLKARYEDQTLWMKCSEIGRYYAVKALVRVSRVNETTIEIDSPLACDDFTLKLSTKGNIVPSNVKSEHGQVDLKNVKNPPQLSAGTYVRNGDESHVCFQLASGKSRLELALA
ncbi:hypothetical protein [Roseiconus lacunae]|uniref:Uncharacterized protein n=1 Tax=Roseiconus lacunae TaxID=2605694 RepID=A0ABT7PJL3_9BACT|nr:hypothetical protein [Roseiconus lacunae]MDM4016693.1 hypothetical protein [Roseiconus lacunae]